MILIEEMVKNFTFEGNRMEWFLGKVLCCVQRDFERFMSSYIEQYSYFIVKC